MTDRAAIAETFPELDEIADDTLRADVETVLFRALRDGAFDDYGEMPWWPPYEEELGDVRQVEHVREVTAYAIAIADAMTAYRDLDLDRDLVVAGALLHDVSKSFELDESGLTAFDELVPHPHYAVHLLAEAGLSDALQHLVLAHSGRSAVEPRTIEALVVSVADRLASDATFWARAGRLNH